VLVGDTPGSVQDIVGSRGIDSCVEAVGNYSADVECFVDMVVALDLDIGLVEVDRLSREDSGKKRFVAVGVGSVHCREAGSLGTLNWEGVLEADWGRGMMQAGDRWELLVLGIGTQIEEGHLRLEDYGKSLEAGHPTPEDSGTILEVVLVEVWGSELVVIEVVDNCLEVGNLALVVEVENILHRSRLEVDCLKYLADGEQGHAEGIL
jgi:hypothetical protein